MRKSILLGVIALVMLVLAAATPVMAVGGSATMDATGGITQTLSISNNVASVAFGQFHEGINENDVAGTLTITSAFVPNWKVTASATDGYGFMRQAAVSPSTYQTPLTNPLEEYNYLGVTPGWQNVQGLTFSGVSSTTMVEAFRQNVLVSDAPGTYSTTITYTIAAV